MKKEILVDSFPLSPMQVGLLFHYLAEPHSGIDIEQMVCSLHEELDVRKFQRAWQYVVTQHPALRTSFHWQEANEPFQRVNEGVTIPFALHDWRGLSESEREVRLGAFLEADRQLGFNLSKAPLIRLALFRVFEADFKLVWTFHHIVADGRSHQVILNDLYAAYAAICQGNQVPSTPARPYRPYIDWLQRQDFSRSKNYWQETLRGFKGPTFIGMMQTNETINDDKAGLPELEVRISEDMTSSLQRIAEENQLKLNTIVQGGWAILQHRYTGERDVVFGATWAARHVPIDNTEDTVGVFINTLPIRVHVSPDIDLLPWLKELRGQHLAVREHVFTPLAQVKAWSDVPRGTALFDSIVVFDNYYLNTRMQAQGGDWKNREFQLHEQTGFPLSLYAYGESELLLKLLYDPRRFARATVIRMLGHLKTLLESIAVNPHRRLSCLPIMTAEERQQILVDWNNTKKDIPENVCIHKLFEAQAERTPDVPAVVFGDQELTYHELNNRANQLARHLRNLGVGPDVRIGIHMERSLELMVGLLGILKAGGAYVPLDPTYPKERLAFMLEDSQAAVLLTQKGLAGKLPKHQSKVVSLDTDWPFLPHEPQEDPANQVQEKNLAYVIYTSGSTGKPKGVMIEHRNVVNFFVGMDELIDHDPPGTWLAVTGISFDISVLELLWTLARGFKVVLFDLTSVMSGRTPLQCARERNDAQANQGDRDTSFPDLIRHHRVSHFQCTPSMAKMLMFTEATRQALKMINNIMIGGEAFPISLARELRSVAGGKIFNMYGPTETTIWSSAEVVRDVDQAISIGRPIANTEFYILDRRMQPVPVGIPGELFISGKGVARGYFNRPELTEEKFIAHPFKGNSPDRLYHTGDLVRYMSDGRVEFLGRLDHQVKIRGFRIELGEVETTLEQHPAIQEAVVIAREDIPAQKRLAAYLVAKSESTPTVHELRTFIKDKLPDYMVPAAFVFMKGFPLTPNGKVNRPALPIPELVPPEPKRHSVPPRSITERELARIWSRVLDIRKIGLHDNFLALGGDASRAAQAIREINGTFDLELSEEKFSNASTLADLALRIDLAKIRKTLVNLSFPTRLSVEICADCNLACTMCHHPQMRRPKGKMPFELWKRCADQVAQESPSTQCWFSFCGEPLLDPDRLIRMIIYGKSAGLQSININTNGMLLTPDLADPILDSGVDLVVFGIDGFSKETYERIRVKGKRDELYANVEHFLERRRARLKGADVQVQFIEMDVNTHELDQFKEYWLERGAIVKYRRMLSWGGTFETPLSIPKEERIPCPWALTMMHVFWDGRVPRCPGDTEGAEGVGNAWEEPLKELWAKLLPYREKHLQHRYDELPERCQICKDWLTGSAERIRPG